VDGRDWAIRRVHGCVVDRLCRRCPDRNLGLHANRLARRYLLVLRFMRRRMQWIRKNEISLSTRKIRKWCKHCSAQLTAGAAACACVATGCLRNRAHPRSVAQRPSCLPATRPVGLRRTLRSCEATAQMININATRSSARMLSSRSQARQHLSVSRVSLSLIRSRPRVQSAKAAITGNYVRAAFLNCAVLAVPVHVSAEGLEFDCAALVLSGPESASPEELRRGGHCCGRH
jgi:hypothetical protein